MPEIDYEHLSDGAKRKISAFALKKGLSIDQALEAIAIEFLAMGGRRWSVGPKRSCTNWPLKRASKVTPKPQAQKNRVAARFLVLHS